MQLEDWIKKDMTRYIKEHEPELSKTLPIRHEDAGMIVRVDYERHVKKALEQQRFREATKHFNDLKEAFLNIPEDHVQERKQYYRILQKCYKLIYEFVEDRHKTRRLLDRLDDSADVFNDDVQPVNLQTQTDEKLMLPSIEEQMFRKKRQMDETAEISLPDAPKGMKAPEESKPISSAGKVQEMIAQEDKEPIRIRHREKVPSEAMPSWNPPDLSFKKKKKQEEVQLKAPEVKKPRRHSSLRSQLEKFSEEKQSPYAPNWQSRETQKPEHRAEVDKQHKSSDANSTSSQQDSASYQENKSELPEVSGEKAASPLRNESIREAVQKTEFSHEEVPDHAPKWAPPGLKSKHKESEEQKTPPELPEVPLPKKHVPLREVFGAPLRPEIKHESETKKPADPRPLKKVHTPIREALGDSHLPKMQAKPQPPRQQQVESRRPAHIPLKEIFRETALPKWTPPSMELKKTVVQEQKPKAKKPVPKKRRFSEHELQKLFVHDTESKYAPKWLPPGEITRKKEKPRHAKKHKHHEPVAKIKSTPAPRPKWSAPSLEIPKKTPADTKTTVTRHSVEALTTKELIRHASQAALHEDFQEAKKKLIEARFEHMRSAEKDESQLQEIEALERQIAARTHRQQPAILDAEMFSSLYVRAMHAMKTGDYRQAARLLAKRIDQSPTDVAAKIRYKECTEALHGQAA